VPWNGPHVDPEVTQTLVIRVAVVVPEQNELTQRSQTAGDREGTLKPTVVVR
jgi:hypothetical protein